MAATACRLEIRLLDSGAAASFKACGGREEMARTRAWQSVTSPLTKGDSRAPPIRFRVRVRVGA